MEQDVRILKEAIIARVARVTDYRVVQYAQVWLINVNDAKQNKFKQQTNANKNSQYQVVQYQGTKYQL